jgi:galactokinase
VSKACEALDAGNIELLGQLLLKHTMVCLENESRANLSWIMVELALADEAVIVPD